MPNVSIYVSDDDVDWLDEHIGRGKVSPYIKSLIDKDKGRVELNEAKKSLSVILDFAMLLIGLAFVVMVVGPILSLPWWGSFGHILILFSGGALLILQSILKISYERRMKNGTRNTSINA